MKTIQSVCPYGSWSSPFDPARVARQTIAVEQLEIDGSDVLWVETRPSEDGRSVLVRWCDGAGTMDISPPGADIRSRVHENGGGAFAVRRGAVAFCDDRDRRLYLQEGGALRPLSPPGPCFADFRFDSRRPRLVGVRKASDGERALVAVPLDGCGETSMVLVSGHDFYAAPRVSPDGSKLAWLAWSWPEMPWTGSELWLGHLDESGRVVDRQRVAGGSGESALQPEWSPAGELHFVSDRSGYWNLYRLSASGVLALACMSAEAARPPTRFGQSAYAFSADGSVILAADRGGAWDLFQIDPHGNRVSPLTVPFCEIAFVKAVGERAVFVAAGSAEPSAVVVFDPHSRRRQVLRQLTPDQTEAEWVSMAVPLQFSASDGAHLHAFYYPPRNPIYRAPANSKPPLLVIPHAGPTRAITTAFQPEVQMWTSRGVAVLDVAYAGTSGFGRDYRRRLDGAWGVLDVEDCTAGARFLASQGDVDRERIGISGGSAGGFTVLGALAHAEEVFQAGASYCGVSDLERLREETHDFEARYLDHLVGPYPAFRERYRERSPVHYADRIRRPVAFFCGRLDRITPPAQTEAMVAALRARGLSVVSFVADDEGHGFRRFGNFRRKLELELLFFARHLGFALTKGGIDDHQETFHTKNG